MSKKYTLTIGIPAYNEAATIKNLVSDLLRQESELVSIRETIIVSDGSTDSTIKELKSVKNTKVTVIEGKIRKGKAKRQNEIIKKCSSDILVFLDADTAIDDKYFLEKLTRPLVAGESDVTSALLDELPPRTFLEKSLNVSMKIKRVLFSEFKKGNNVYNCHGPARAFTKEVYTRLNFKEDAGEDMYSYFTTLSLGKRFTFVPEAVIRYRLPSTYSDYIKQSVRYLNIRQKFVSEFGLKVKSEFHISFFIYLKAAVKCSPIIFRKPFHSGYYLLVYFFAKIESIFRKDLKNTWNITSSKQSINVYE